MDQDGNPAGELKQLDEIVRCSDCIFTPVHGVADLSDVFYDIYMDYKLPAWNAAQFGYVNRGWCRVEMFYACNIFRMPLTRIVYESFVMVCIITPLKAEEHI